MRRRASNGSSRRLPKERRLLRRRERPPLRQPIHQQAKRSPEKKSSRHLSSTVPQLRLSAAESINGAGVRFRVLRRYRGRSLGLGQRTNFFAFLSCFRRCESSFPAVRWLWLLGHGDIATVELRACFLL